MTESDDVQHVEVNLLNTFSTQELQGVEVVEISLSEARPAVTVQSVTLYKCFVSLLL